MRRFWFAAVIVFLVGPMLWAEEPSDRFVRIYDLIQQADALKDGGHSDRAREKYLVARSELEALRKAYPDWNESVVGFRLKYVADKLGTNAPPASNPASPATGRESDRGPAIGDSAGLVPLLQEQIRRLTADDELLRAKLKEALTAQPAAVDPRELARAEEKIKTLQKETDVLKVNLAKAESRPDKPIDPAVLADARQSLAEAKDKLAQLGETLSALSLEKAALQNRLQSFVEGAEVRALREDNASLKRHAEDLKSEAATRLREWTNRLVLVQAEAASQRARAETLAADKKALEAKLNELNAHRETNLVARTRSLEKELAEAKAAAQSNAALVSAVQTALATAKREISELEAQNRALAARPPSASPPPDRVPSEGGSTLGAGELGKLSEQNAALRARLEVLEAQKSPYSAEELALLARAEPVLAGGGVVGGGKLTVVAAAGGLVSEAERAFSAGRYEEAEKKYATALHADQKNAALRANLAAAQMEQNRLEPAEENLKKALAEGPRDAFSLSLLGILKLRQKKYDEALDALTRAAQIDPQNAEIFQNLGVVLAEQGQRAPAEAAFRRAVQLAPGNADAHHNLAVIYATQQPPATELARWHYQKALAAGHGKDLKLEERLKR